MSRTELVVLALVPLEEAGDPIGLPQRGEPIVAAGEQLPGVGLMAHVPQDLVAGGIELVQQRDRQFHGPQAGADVAARQGDALDQPGANLLGQLGQLLPGDGFEVGGTVDASE